MAENAGASAYLYIFEWSFQGNTLQWTKSSVLPNADLYSLAVGDFTGVKTDQIAISGDTESASTFGFLMILNDALHANTMLFNKIYGEYGDPDDIISIAAADVDCDGRKELTCLGIEGLWILDDAVNNFVPLYRNMTGIIAIWGMVVPGDFTGGGIVCAIQVKKRPTQPRPESWSSWQYRLTMPV